MEINEWIAQALGVLAIILGFLSYQVKSRKRMLLTQLLTTATFVVHYLLLGAYSAMVMNAVGIVRTGFFYHKEKPFFNWKGWPIFFAVVSGIMGIIAWEAWYSVFVFFGLVIHTVCLAFNNPQNIRKSILVTSPLVLTYDLFAKSWSGAVYETVAIVSAAVGIARFYSKKGSVTEDD